MRLLNVRIGDDDARLVRRLRERGVSISDVVRRAIRAEAQRVPPAEVPDIDALIEQMRAAFPPPEGFRPAARVRSTDRNAFRALVRRKLRRPR